MGDLIVVFIVLLPLVWIAGAIWFFRGPARAANRHLEAAIAPMSDERDRALFRRMYAAKRPRSVLAAWLLTSILSPSVSYVYQREWPKAIIAFVTLQGFGLWWFVSVFTMPTEVMRHNKRLIDEALNDFQLARPSGVHQVNVFTTGETSSPSSGDTAPVSPGPRPNTQP